MADLHPVKPTNEQRARALRFTLLCLLLPPTEPEFKMLHKCFDSRAGVSQIATGLRRQGLNVTLTRIGSRLFIAQR